MLAAPPRFGGTAGIAAPSQATLAEFSVRVDSVAAAGGAVRDAVRSAGAGELSCDPGAVGHGGLGAAAGECCARWQVGVSHLLSDAEGLAGRLAASAATYAGREAHTTALFGAG